MTQAGAPSGRPPTGPLLGLDSALRMAWAYSPEMDKAPAVGRTRGRRPGLTHPGASRDIEALETRAADSLAVGSTQTSPGGPSRASEAPQWLTSPALSPQLSQREEDSGPRAGIRWGDAATSRQSSQDDTGPSEYLGAGLISRTVSWDQGLQQLVLSNTFENDLKSQESRASLAEMHNEWEEGTEEPDQPGLPSPAHSQQGTQARHGDSSAPEPQSPNPRCHGLRDDGLWTRFVSQDGRGARRVRCSRRKEPRGSSKAAGSATMVQHPQHWIHVEASGTRCLGPRTYLRELQAPPWKENDILQTPATVSVFLLRGQRQASRKGSSEPLAPPGSTETQGWSTAVLRVVSSHLSAALITKQSECPEK
ncbi:hypothetical protein MJT46_001861 [Ovis ammon polii x Ovis aries]|nr:hypothetical protein MJT46_001861 [Ovis ammon polii x Ovis aries]